MAAKQLAIKFTTTDKSQIKGRVGHTRTGACTAKGKCFHGMKPQHQRRKGR